MPSLRFIGQVPAGALVHPVAGPTRSDDFVLVALTDEGQRALRTLCHTDEQRRAFALPHHSFVVRAGRISEQQLLTHRPSYVNALLIASRGTMLPSNGCMRSRATFGIPTVLFGFWGGACAGCKWKDQSTYCSFVSNSRGLVQGLTSQVTGQLPSSATSLVLGSSGNPILIGDTAVVQEPIVIDSSEEEDEVEEVDENGMPKLKEEDQDAQPPRDDGVIWVDGAYEV